jgi:hypothetical protein
MWIYLLGIIQEYLVILNIYNGDLIFFISTDIEYSIIDLLTLIYLFYNYNYIINIDIFFILFSFIAHIQWYLHSPFGEWPNWWIAEKSENDIRHRTEYYDTHVMCFTIYLLLFLRFYDKLKKNQTSILF